MVRLPSPPTVKNTLLLVCDVQHRFRPAIFGFDAMAGSIRKFLEAAKIMELGVVITEQIPGSTVSDIGLEALPPHLNLGVFPKTKFSMFIPEVQTLVRSRGIENVIVVGIEAHFCVLQTALDFLQNGTGVYIAADAVSSCNKQEIPIALSRLQASGAIVTTTESILFELIRDASDSSFEQLSKLIKDHTNLELLPAYETSPM